MLFVYLLDLAVQKDTSIQFIDLIPFTIVELNLYFHSPSSHVLDLDQTVFVIGLLDLREIPRVSGVTSTLIG